MGGGGLTPAAANSLSGALAAVTLAEVAVAFGERLRRAGVPVTPEQEGRFSRAILLANPLRLSELAHLGKVTLVSERHHLHLFDQAFGEVFRGQVDPAEARGDTAQPQTKALSRRRLEAASAEGTLERAPSELRTGDDQEEVPELPMGVLGAGERLAHKDFSNCTEAELAQLTELISELPLILPLRRSRRLRRTRHGSAPDLRATLRRAHRTGGDPVELLRRSNRHRPRRLVLLADVSGSMEPYTRVYLHLFHGAVRVAGAETFVFATRLTRLTDALAASDPDQALRRAGGAADDWAGGTRIGQSLEEFNDRYGRRGMARGAILVIVSDGWEGGDPALLGQQMARLARLAHRVVWVNPRSARSSFEPLTGGMAAAMPHLDQMVSGHSLAAVATLLEAIRGDSR